MNSTFTTRAFGVLTAAAAVGLLLAPGAAAGPLNPGADGGNVAAFLDQLGATQAGLPGKSAHDNVKAGMEACRQLRKGVSVLDEISAVETTYQFSQGTLFVSAATTNLCPDFAG